jgi:hypothetical protein
VGPGGEDGSPHASPVGGSGNGGGNWTEPTDEELRSLRSNFWKDKLKDKLKDKNTRLKERSDFGPGWPRSVEPLQRFSYFAK